MIFAGAFYLSDSLFSGKDFTVGALCDFFPAGIMAPGAGPQILAYFDLEFVKILLAAIDYVASTNIE